MCVCTATDFSGEDKAGTATGTGNPWAQCSLVSTDVRTIVDHSLSIFAALYY